MHFYYLFVPAAHKSHFLSVLPHDPKMDRATLRMAIAAMANPQAIAREVAKKLQITTATLYAYVNGDGSLKRAGEILMAKKFEKTLNQTHI